MVGGGRKDEIRVTGRWDLPRMGIVHGKLTVICVYVCLKFPQTKS